MLFRMALYIFNFCDFAKLLNPLGFNILIRILYSVQDVYSLDLFYVLGGSYLLVRQNGYLVNLSDFILTGSSGN
jgi:hypothetical protein